MSEKQETNVKTAQINARQAITVAIISGISGVIIALIASGAFSSNPNQSSAKQVTNNFGTGEENQTTNNSTLKAPHIKILSRPIPDQNIEECIKRGEQALNKENFTGVRNNESAAWGYSGDYIGMVWCNMPFSQVVITGSGIDYGKAKDVANKLDRSF